MVMSILTLPFRVIGFILWFFYQIFISAGQVIIDILLPARKSDPRVVRLRLGDIGSFHTMVTSICITITPGTVVLGVVSDDREGVTLLVHTLYYSSAEEARDDLSSIDRRLMKAVRIGGADARH